MSETENKRLYEHYNNVIDGNVKSGNAVRDDLNVSDAKRHLADLIKKNPSLEVKEEKPKEEVKEEVKPTKSKGKK